MLLRLIPNIFYDTLAEALDLFVDGLGFTLLHQEGDLAVVGRDGAKAYLVASPEFAAKDRPEVILETDAIDADRASIGQRRPDLLHGNLRDITVRPWGAREFAVLDRTGVCVVFRQWS